MNEMVQPPCLKPEIPDWSTLAFLPCFFWLVVNGLFCKQKERQIWKVAHDEEYKEYKVITEYIRSTNEYHTITDLEWGETNQQTNKTRKCWLWNDHLTNTRNKTETIGSMKYQIIPSIVYPSDKSANIK